MEKEIKFRGKDLENNEWLFGSLQVFKDGTTTIMFTEKGDKGYTSPVDSKTIGEYTGKNDKNGNEIYEGDIIRVNHPIYDPDSSIDGVHFINGCWRLTSDNKADIPLFNYRDECLEVIGNLF